MCLELRGGHKGVFWNLPPYRDADLLEMVGRWRRAAVRGAHGKTGLVGSVPPRRSALVLEGVEEWISIHHGETADRGTSAQFISQGTMILTDPSTDFAAGRRFDPGEEDPRK